MAGVGLALFVFALVYSQLPPIDTVVDYKPKVPMRVWTADGKLIAEFGEERRDFVTINEIPPLVKEALISAEDDGFYQHAGIEPKGFIRAALNNLATGRKSQGASTITMQVARNFFLSSERSYIRKLYEVAMAFKIEANLSKNEILQIYMNQIFLGNRAYGFAAAARTYYGKKPSAADGRRSCHSGRSSSRTLGLQPVRKSQTRQDASRLCARPHERFGLYLRS